MLGGARRVATVVSLRVSPLVGAGPGHAKRVVFAELSRGRIGQAGGISLVCAREKGGRMVPSHQRGVPQ